MTDPVLLKIVKEFDRAIRILAEAGVYKNKEEKLELAAKVFHQITGYTANAEEKDSVVELSSSVRDNSYNY